MKFYIPAFALIALVPQAAWSACDLSATTPSETDITRQLTNADTAALTEAAKQNDDITDCDVSGITSMAGLFYYNPNAFGVTSFNQDIGEWDVSNVTDMSNMFRFQNNFNQDISGWDVSNVTNMMRMFVYSSSFNQAISGWDVSNVNSFFAMFESAVDFNQDIRGWNVSSATTFQGMFLNATAMNVNFATPDTPTSSFFSDTTAPMVAITAAEVNDGDTSADATLALTFTISEPTTDFAVGDITVSNGTLGNFAATSSTVYTATFTPTSEGPTTIDVVSSTFTDAAANANTAASQFNWAYNTTAPMVAITAAEVNDGDTSADATLALTFTISEPTTDFAVGDITVSNGTLGNFAATSSTVYTATFTPTSEGPTTIDVVSSTFTDAAANANTAASQFNWAYNTTAPMVAITAAEVNDGDTSADATLALTFTISEPTTDFAVGDITVSNGTLGNFAATSSTVYTATFTPTSEGPTTIDVASSTFTDAAANANTAASQFNWAYNTTTTTPSPASEFATKEDAIRSVITDDAQRSLNGTIASNTRLTRDARGRLLTSRAQMQSDGAGLASCNNEAFDVDGTAVASVDQIATQGTFSAQTGSFEGTQCRLVFGDYDIQRDGDTGSTTATIKGKASWEQMLSEKTMLGYHLGVKVSQSNIRGSFTGTQRKYGINIGGYFVHALQGNLFLDGFMSLGAGRNNSEIADDTLDLTSDYDTRTGTMGAAVSGVYEYGQYDFHPELALSYGKTWIGDVGFTGVSYSLTDDTLSLDAGDVSITNLTLRPEIVWALDAETVADSNTQLSFAPRFICQRTSAVATTQDCGAGAEIGLSSTSQDGLSSANIRLVMDRLGNSKRSSFALNFERSF